MSLLLCGQVCGYKEKGFTNKQTGEYTPRHYIGIRTPKENGYEDEFIIHDVRISSKLYQSGLQGKYEKIKGYDVKVPVFVTAWAGKNGNAGISYFFAEDGMPIEAKDNR